MADRLITSKLCRRKPSASEMPFPKSRLQAVLNSREQIPEDIFDYWERRGLDGYTYFARGEWTGRIKIGRSNDPWRRVGELGNSRSGEPSHLVLTLRGYHLEAIYHDQFREHLDRNEWFHPHPDILAEIERLNAEAAHDHP